MGDSALAAADGCSMIRKALCYVTRGRALLVFRHRDAPEAGLQVPAGTVLPDERPDAAALREAAEETGRADFRLVRRLGVYAYRFDQPPRREWHERHVFHLLAPPDAPDRWAHFAEGAHWFDCTWVPLGADPGLAAGQGDLHHHLA